MYIAVSGEESVATALEIGEGICSVEPKRELVEQFTEGGGDAQRTWGQIPVSWDASRDHALELARQRFRFGLAGWRVMAELPDWQSFDAATQLVKPQNMAETVPSGDDPQGVIDGIAKYTDAGYENVAVVQVGDDLDGFLAAWQHDIRPKLA
jgi:G6PDH family F420-dependent oxidoreductase